MEIISSISQVRETLKMAANQAAKQGDKIRIGLVPTMGYLHEGHRQLILEAVKTCSYVVISIFVNPLQFGPNEDYTKYPRDLDNDIKLCQEAGANILFVPNSSEIIGTTPLSYVNIERLDQHLCGASRPGHFRGVCTILCKLFNIIQPQYAFFGKKDIQQLKIIQRMTAELNFPIRIIEVDTVRASDGLALSSRNKYLTPEERKAAKIVPDTLKFIVQKIEANAALNYKAKSMNIPLSSTEQILTKSQILAEARSYVAMEPLAKIDYLEIVEGKELQPTQDFDQEIIIAVAIYIGSTRLIDNKILYAPQPFNKVSCTL